jgi:hypothetical protein
MIEQEKINKKRESRRRSYHKNKEKANKTHREWMERNKIYVRSYLRDQWHNDVKRKVRAHTSKVFKKPKVCERCGSKKDLQWHHKKYKLPMERKHLVGLCRKCHAKIHRGDLKS